MSEVVQITQTVVRVGEVIINWNCLIKCVNSILLIFDILVGYTQPIVSKLVVWICYQSLVEILDSLIGVTFLQWAVSHPIQRWGWVWIHLQCLLERVYCTCIISFVFILFSFPKMNRLIRVSDFLNIVLTSNNCFWLSCTTLSHLYMRFLYLF